MPQSDHPQITSASSSSELYRFLQEWFSFLNNKLNQLQQGIQKMALDLTALQSAVAAETSADQSIVTLVNNMAAQIKELAAQVVDPAVQTQLNDFASQLEANATVVLNAVNANTTTTPAPTTTTPAPATP